MIFVCTLHYHYENDLAFIKKVKILIREIILIMYIQTFVSI